MIKDLIIKQNRTDKDIERINNSNFHIIFEDGSEAHEKDHNWSDFSELKRVNYKDGEKSIHFSKHKIKHIHIEHFGQVLDIDVPKGHDVYQAMRGESFFVPHQDRNDQITGRVVGFVKDNEIVQEFFINNREGTITGFKK